VIGPAQLPEVVGIYSKPCEWFLVMMDELARAKILWSDGRQIKVPGITLPRC